MERKKTSTLISILSLATVFSGCASFTGAEHSGNLSQLETGMTQSQVLNLLGTPDSIYRKNGVDKWVYEFRKKSNGGKNVSVEFRDRIVVRHGEMSGREIAAAEEQREPGTCTKITNPKDFRFEPLCSD